MKTSLKAVMATAALLGLAGCVETADPTGPGLPSVGSSSDLSEFEGARAGQAEMGIRSLGYEVVRQNGLTSYWFNRSTGACAEIVTSDGRYSRVTMLPAEDC
jgi:hypothetical protein